MRLREGERVRLMEGERESEGRRESEGGRLREGGRESEGGRERERESEGGREGGRERLTAELKLVLMIPGAMQLTLIAGASSLARALVSPRRAVLLAE